MGKMEPVAQGDPSTGDRTCALSHACALPPGSLAARQPWKLLKWKYPLRSEALPSPERFSVWEHVAGLSWYHLLDKFSLFLVAN